MSIPHKSAKQIQKDKALKEPIEQGVTKDNSKWWMFVLILLGLASCSVLIRTILKL